MSGTAAGRRRRRVCRSDDGRRHALRPAGRRAGGRGRAARARDRHAIVRRARRVPRARVCRQVAHQPHPPRAGRLSTRARCRGGRCAPLGRAGQIPDRCRRRRLARLMIIPLVALAVVTAFMLGELVISRRNERTLFARGATTPPDPVYGTMRWAYPGAFLAMAVEAAVAGTPSAPVMAAGIAVFAVAKALKFWAIGTLGVRWTYRVLVVPGAPLVTAGPYRWIRHPNYVGVLGELIGVALVTGARFSGPLAILFFSWLLRRRIQAEERALGIGIY